MTSTDDTAIEPDADDPDSGYNEQNPSGVTAQTHHTLTGFWIMTKQTTALIMEPAAATLLSR